MAEEAPEHECPKCGNTKHQEVIRVELEHKETELFRCKACGYSEYDFSEYQNGKENDSVEKMGDAFREFLKK